MVKQFGFEELDSEDEMDLLVDAQKAKNLIFEKNENGDFIILDKSNFKLIHQKQRVVWGYIGMVYSEYIHLFIYSFNF